MRFDLFLQTNVNGTSPNVEDADNIPIGDVVAGQHSTFAYCIRPVATTETTLSDVVFYLESLDTLDAEIGFYQQITYAQQTPNNDNLSLVHLTAQANAQRGDPNGKTLTVFDTNKVSWVWLDCEVADTQRELNTTTNRKRFDLNFRVVFDYT